MAENTEGRHGGVPVLDERALEALLLELELAADPWDGVTRIYDPEGNERDADWLEAWYGGVMPGIVRADAGASVGSVAPSAQTAADVAGAGLVMRCTELRTKDGEATQVVFTRDADNRPLTGIAVGRWWDSAPGLPLFPEDCLASRPYEIGVWGITDGDLADVGFGMGSGDFPPGSSAVWVIHCEAPSDVVTKLGWAIGENHRVVWPVYRLVAVDDEPEPEPEDGGDYAEIVEAIDRLGSGLVAELSELREQLGLGWLVEVGRG